MEHLYVHVYMFYNCLSCEGVNQVSVGWSLFLNYVLHYHFWEFNILVKSHHGQAWGTGEANAYINLYRRAAKCCPFTPLWCSFNRGLVCRGDEEEEAFKSAITYQNTYTHIFNPIRDSIPASVEAQT